MKEKFYIGSVAGIAAFVAAVPHNVRNYLALIFILVTVDTITGILGAIVCRELRSSHMRQKLFAKTLQYLMFFTVGFAATILSESYIFLVIVCSGIMASEISSMVENLSKMQQGGISLGPFNHFITMLSGFFAIERREHTTTVTTATVIPPDLDTSPVITTTGVSTDGRARTRRKDDRP